MVKDFKKYVHFLSNFCPLQICNKDILKSVIARSLKLGQLIEDDE